MRLRTQRRALGGGNPGAAAAGFACGVACALLLLVGHHHHSKAHEGSRTLPGQLPGSELTTASAGAAAEQQPGAAAAGGAAAATAATASPAPPAAPPPVPLPDLDVLPHLFVSFGNAAYFELAHNWAKSVQQTGAPFLIAAFDDEMLGLCAAAGLPCERVHFGAADSDNFRGDFRAFRAMGAVKVDFVRQLLDAHPTLGLVVVSDTDTVWLREPWAYFEQRPASEFFISTDCLSVQTEEEWKKEHGQPRCGHIPENYSGRAFNTGLFATRNTPAARAFLAAWSGMLTDPSREHHTDPAHRGIDDQMALNLLFDQGGIAPVGADDPRGIMVWNQTLHTQPLPVALFANGHVAFVQRSPEKHGVSPIVIHADFVRWQNSGKKERLREFGLWHMDPPSYYGIESSSSSSSGSGSSGSGSSGGGSSGGGAADGQSSSGGKSGGGEAGGDETCAPLRLLTYDNDVKAFVAVQEAARYGGRGHGMPLMEKNWVGASYQLSALRDAFAAARMLGRVLVLPQMWCWCDFDEHPLILESCRIRGTDLELPFKCPLDFLLPVGRLDRTKLEYRPAGFLDLPQVPAVLRKSRSALPIAAQRPAEAFPKPSLTIGHAATLWPGIKQGELVRAVEPVGHARVLTLRGRVPGFLGGFDDPAANEAFDATFRQAVLDWADTPYWCCFTWGDADADHRKLHYAMPAPLAGGWQPWQAPVLQAPPWCDQVSEKHGNRDFSLLPQHPCMFLRNATAAALAAT